MGPIPTPGAGPGRLLYLGVNYHPAIGGAEVTDQLLLEAWVAHGGSARAVHLGSGPATVLRGVEVMPVSSRRAMRTAGLAYSPDLVYAQVGTHALGADLAALLGVPSLTYLHDARPLCPDMEALVGCDRNCSACPVYHRYPTHEGRALLQAFDRILAPSRFMADLAGGLLGRGDIVVLHPAVRRVVPEATTTPAAIAMSAAERVKGADLFLQIAERMPDHRFLLAGRGRASRCGYDPTRHGNVRLAGQLPPGQFYGESWLVLMPSRIPESFGRMAPEAQSAGRIFMGSRIGGIPEAAGESGILVDNYLDPEAWVRAIRALEADPGRQARLRTLGEAAWKRFEATTMADRFCGEVQSLMDRQAGPRRSMPSILKTQLPWHVPAILRWTLYASFGATILGGPLVFLGFPRGCFLIPFTALLASLGLLGWVHAAPLLKVGALPASPSGRKLARSALLLAGLLPILLLGKWGIPALWLATLLLLPRVRVHRRQGQEARNSAGIWR